MPRLCRIQLIIQMMKGRDDMSAIDLLRFLPKNLSRVLSGYGMFQFAEELRLRSGKPASFYAEGSETVTDYVTQKIEIEQAVAALSDHSLYAVREDIAKGFFTLKDGVRVGVGGKVVSSGNEITMIRDFTSVNIRFPTQKTGIARGLLKYITKGGRLEDTVILSPPQFGKTTYLRDVVRAASYGEGCMPQKCTVVDERGELFGGGDFDLGPRTDVLYTCPKARGMAMALRSLSPDVIATDEIGGEDDLSAIKEAANCGVCVVATAHAGSVQELMGRLFFRRLFDEGIIKRFVVLGDELGRGTVREISDNMGNVLSEGPFMPKGR